MAGCLVRFLPPIQKQFTKSTVFSFRVPSNLQSPALTGLRSPFHISNIRSKKTSASTVVTRNVFSNSSKKRLKNGRHQLQASLSSPFNLRVATITLLPPFSAVSAILRNAMGYCSLWMKFRPVWAVRERSGLMRNGVLRRGRSQIS